MSSGWGNFAVTLLLAAGLAGLLLLFTGFHDDE